MTTNQKQEELMNGLKLNALFAISPSSLGMCGKQTTADILIDCIKKGKCKNLPKELKGFSTLYPYLKTISRTLQKPVFSLPVAEYYWLGKIGESRQFQKQLLIKNLAMQGYPEDVISTIERYLPKEIIPIHIFPTIISSLVQLGTIDTQQVSTGMVGWGLVKKVYQQSLVVNTKVVSETLKLIQTEKEAYVPEWNRDIYKPGDLVLIHHNNVVCVADSQTVEQLIKTTTSVLNLFK